MEHDEQGYDDRRFEGPVRPDLFCSICHGVLRNPRACQNKEHPFCLACISQHLQNSHTCPECREHLTPKTLKNPPRFLMNTLIELKINCEYHDRGCSSYLKLENLQNHVDQCGFAPVMCENEGCGTEVNRRDKEIHERDLCQFRIAICYDCREIKASQGEMKAELIQVKASQDEMKANQDEMKVEVIRAKASQDEMKSKQDEIKANQDGMRVKVTGIERKQNQIKANVDEIKQTQVEMKADQAMFKADVKQQLEKMTEMLNQLLQGTNLNNNGAQAINSSVLGNSQDIIILGGWRGQESVLNAVEKFNTVERKSARLPPMIHPRVASASCVYDNDVMVVGGYDGQAGTDSIEILKINEDPLRWLIFNGKLPMKLYSHVVIAYQHILLVIGGVSETKVSDGIYEVSLTSPYASKLLVRMVKPRTYHRAEFVNGKLYILGGTTTGQSKDATGSVLAYDLIKNECKPCSSLPYPVYLMSTVTWGSMIIVVGGQNENDQVLNDVIMYDTETGQSQILPSLIYKRGGCSCVIVNDVIVVLGGWNKEQGYLNSVECFTMVNQEWRELPEVKEKRSSATAVVKPGN